MRIITAMKIERKVCLQVWVITIHAELIPNRLMRSVQWCLNIFLHPFYAVSTSLDSFIVSCSKVSIAFNPCYMLSSYLLIDKTWNEALLPLDFCDKHVTTPAERCFAKDSTHLSSLVHVHLATTFRTITYYLIYPPSCLSHHPVSHIIDLSSHIWHCVSLVT